MRFLKDIKGRVVNFLNSEFEKSRYIMVAGALLSFLGHPLYYSIYTFLFPQPYDSLFFRFTSSIISIPLLFTLYYPDRFKSSLMIYWYFWVTFILPITFTFIMLMNDASTLWIMAETMMVFLVIFFVSNVIIVFAVLGLGFSTGYLCFIYHSSIDLSINILQVVEYLFLLPLAIICGIVFTFTAKKGERAQIRAKSLESLGVSIAHEMRNPLGSIHQSAYIIIKKLHEISQSREKNGVFLSKKEIAELEELLEIIDHSSIRGNMVIDMILSNIKGKEIDKSKFKIYQVSEVIETAIKEFAFAGSAERAKVSSNLKDNFYFKGDENMLVFVLFNLLKNALYYLKAYPESRITINSKQGDDGFNYLYFCDTGPGIPKDKLESIFESFITSGKAEGTGLGLPFCRRVVTAFEGKIFCNSKLGEYTEFIISFPKLSEEDEKKKEELLVKKDTTDYEVLIKEKYGDKIALLADDQLVNRRISANRLEHLGLKVFTAENGKGALKVLEEQGNIIDIIFMDLQMPEIDGYETTNLIKGGRRNKEGAIFNNFTKYKEVPIVAFTGDEDDETVAKIKTHNMQCHIGKSWNNQQLLAVLDKAFKCS